MLARTIRVLIVPEDGETAKRFHLVIETIVELFGEILAPGLQTPRVIAPPHFELVGIPDRRPRRSEKLPPFFSILATVDRTTADLTERLRLFQDQLKSLHDIDVTVQSDLPLSPALWTDTGTFGTADQALELIGANGLAPTKFQSPVNVVVVDQGFNGKLFPGNFAGGIAVDGRQPGKGRSEHAAMIARDILRVAPTARLYDCPIIPTPAIGAMSSLDNVYMFTLAAAALCDCIAIPLVAASDQPWIFVNAWAVFDRSTDFGLIKYCDDPLHALNLGVSALVDAGADVIFAAGNCGQFDADRRCTAEVRGPCHSILGANSLDAVVTAGAVRMDVVPLGYCSQGPGQPLLGIDKPDFCAPSDFAETYDRAKVSSGSSASAALTAGVVAVLRATWSRAEKSPAELKATLIGSATPIPPFGVSDGVGAGVINLARAMDALGA